MGRVGGVTAGGRRKACWRTGKAPGQRVVVGMRIEGYVLWTMGCLEGERLRQPRPIEIEASIRHFPLSSGSTECTQRALPCSARDTRGRSEGVRTREWGVSFQTQCIHTGDYRVLRKVTV